MLTVRNLRRAPTFGDWLRANSSLLIALALWALAVLWLASVTPPEVDGQWYSLSSVEGQLAAIRMSSQDACQASVAGDALACIPAHEWR
ncbi:MULTISPECIES: hypothetical protein [Variovorax]|jgi:hypothetical protein|uniref:hypothetical protein n=1 Tax=Variovorax TaxID=34072 RepID=UPI000D4B8DA3|nr:hypothetical protein [Variovorax sp.]